MKQLLGAAILVFGFATPALADHCPKDARLIMDALKEQENYDALVLLDKGLAAHRARKHEEALKSLHEAMKLLGIEH